ncbi:hypothetical protein [Siccirubricoccus sp. G192]|uniref:hypothetical protein n=1 Tax=Siccirubricoccus sp. G192 TaxID=2849651 RepID=UPI001C2B8D64|nr:hypothetical protein [Siccirubricoccus sp. G192]MBV1797642.1 hypothetical protein [Siccirubricoccus sp. G192]
MRNELGEARVTFAWRLGSASQAWLILAVLLAGLFGEPGHGRAQGIEAPAPGRPALPEPRHLAPLQVEPGDFWADTRGWQAPPRGRSPAAATERRAMEAEPPRTPQRGTARPPRAEGGGTSRTGACRPGTAEARTRACRDAGQRGRGAPG